MPFKCAMQQHASHDVCQMILISNQGALGCVPNKTYLNIRNHSPFTAEFCKLMMTSRCRCDAFAGMSCAAFVCFNTEKGLKHRFYLSRFTAKCQTTYVQCFVSDARAGVSDRIYSLARRLHERLTTDRFASGSYRLRRIYEAHPSLFIPGTALPRM